MLNNLIYTRIIQVAAGLTLCAFSITSQATPFSLVGSCHLTSIIPGQGECFITAFVNDNDFISPSILRRAVLKVNGINVSDQVNDTLNPAGSSFTGAIGAVAVPCGTSHVVTAFVAEVGGTFLKVGSIPKVQCPAAP